MISREQQVVSNRRNDNYSSLPIVIGYCTPIAYCLRGAAVAIGFLMIVGAGFQLVVMSLRIITAIVFQKYSFNLTWWEDYFSLWLIGFMILFLWLGIRISSFFISARLEIDNEGFRLPWFMRSTVQFKNYQRWSEIISCDIDLTGVRPHLSLGTLGGNIIKLDPKNFSSRADLEKFCVSLRSRCHALKHDKSIFQMLDSQETNSVPRAVSYTKLWLDGAEQRVGASLSEPIQIGNRFYDNRLRVLEILSCRGLISTYLCLFDEKRLVVVREHIHSSDSESSQKAENMLQREGKILLTLEHPRIARVLDVFVQEGKSYLVIEYFEGVALSEFVRERGPLLEQDVLEKLIQLLDILEYLHSHEPPVIHRDVSPDNLVVDKNGEVSLIDFGTANLFTSGCTGTIVGKTAYMPPEQFRGKYCVQSDIYAFGCVAFFMLTGTTPVALTQSNPKLVSPRISNELNEVVLRCTEQDFARRYVDAIELKKRLLEIKGDG